MLVADDASPDGTGAIADELAERDARVHVLHRPGKEGLGAAYLAGFDWGLERGYDVLVEMDADGSHAPEQLPRLLAALDDADVVLGSRWVPGGAVVNWPRRREVLSRGGNLYARLALGIAGARRDRRLPRLPARGARGDRLAAVGSQGYCFQVDLAWRACSAGFGIVEVPITFAERERGVSKMSARSSSRRCCGSPSGASRPARSGRRPRPCGPSPVAQDRLSRQTPVAPCCDQQPAQDVPLGDDLAAHLDEAVHHTLGPVGRQVVGHELLAAAPALLVGHLGGDEVGRPDRSRRRSAAAPRRASRNPPTRPQGRMPR